MKKSELNLLYIEIINIIILILNIFLTNILGLYGNSVLFIISIITIYCLYGYEKDKFEYKKSLYILISLFTISFIILQYGLGLICGYTRNAYNLNLTNIVKNIIPTTIFILISELLRYFFCKKGEKNKIILILSIIILILADIGFNLPNKFYSNKEQIDFIALVVLPAIFKNISLFFITYKYSYKGSIIYRLLLEMYGFILPILPNFGEYMKSVLAIIYPIILYRILIIYFDKKKKISLRENNTNAKIIKVIIVLIIIILIGLNSNLFRYWSAVVATGSMQPTIDIGDVIIVDKMYKKHPDKLKKGDVLVFRQEKKIYTHRIIKIKIHNNNYSIYTKGDRKGQATDSWIVEKSDIIGKVKFKIKYIGIPSIWVKDIMEEK